jgi:hypothetical protein
VLRDDQAARATVVIREALRPERGPRAAPWHCRHCGEDNEAQFAACWSCGCSDASPE